MKTKLEDQSMSVEQTPFASIGFELSAITEASAGVIGDSIKPMETYQDFTNNGTAVIGGSAGQRIWTDKSYVPITLKTQCIDCLHCVVACPHHAIGYEIEKKEAPFVIQTTKQILNLIPGFHFAEENSHEVVHKSDTDYNFCKGCFVCASACPVGAIHFVPKEFVNYEIFKGAPIEPEEVATIFLPPIQKNFDLVEKIAHKTSQTIKEIKVPTYTEKQAEDLFNGSDMMGRFTFQAQFDMATMFPITPNTSLLKYLEDKSKKQDPNAEHYFTIRTCLSEESGYAWLTGGAVRGKRCLMAQGSQSMAQLFEHMNINPGLHLPVLMFELTRAIAPGTSIKPDHTTTLRTADTGEIILFGRGIQDNYEKAILLLKLMESDGIWVPGRLVIKGFVETHTLSTTNQVNMKFLPDQVVQDFLGHPKNPFVFSEKEVRSVGILDFDARYGEQRQAIDQVLLNVGKKFDEVSLGLSKITGNSPIQKISRYPEVGQIDLAIISLNDPDLNTAELVADQLIHKNIKCGVVAINLYRPFPAKELAVALKGAKAIAILDYSNGSGRAGGAQLSNEVRSALYSVNISPEIISVQVGLGGRAVTIPYLLLIFRVLQDLATSAHSKAREWLQINAPDNVLFLGNRGNSLPPTDADFDVPITQENVQQIVVVGKGGQGVLLLNGLLTGLASIKNQCALSMVGYGALQRGGGITLSFKYSDQKIRDYSDIILTDTLVSFEDDIHLEAMLPQLKVGGTLILDGEPERYAAIKNKLPEETKLIILPAKSLAIKLYNNATRTNLILYGAILAHMGIKDELELTEVIGKLQTMPSVAKEANILTRPKGMAGLFSGFYAYKAVTKKINLENILEKGIESIETIESFRQRILPSKIDLVLHDKEQLRKVKWWYNTKKSLYQLMFQLHPMVSQIQSMYLAMRGKTPISGGDMACGGCGQINIFRNVFNFLYYLQKEKGKILVSEQDGCGTVFSGMNRTSIWNVPYIRIAFETAHGIASGLTEDLNKDDIVVSISGDGGLMQGIRSVEDALHHQDPILHLVVVNQTLGNTGGQSTSTTLVGAKTRDGHIAKQNAVNFLKIAEKHHVEGAFASSVNLSDLYKKIRYAHNVVKKDKKPFLLIMNFSCLEQGMNLARSLSMQKIGLDAHYFNLYTMRYRPITNSSKQILYYKKEINIDYYPFVFGKSAWKKKLKEYAGHQAMMKEIHDDPIKLEAAYGQLKGEWEELKKEMGTIRYYWGFFKSIFSLSRFTMMRLIQKDIPEEAKE